jgi:hypothetical protein
VQKKNPNSVLLGIRSGVGFVALFVDRGGYDFAEPKKFLDLFRVHGHSNLRGLTKEASAAFTVVLRS